MPHREFLGRRASLRIQRFSPHGAHLALQEDRDDGDTATILLPGADIPTDAQEGTSIDVFVYLDSEDRPIATTAKPKLQRGEVAFLTVTDLTKVGAFADWGLPKELLLPFAQHTTLPEVGQRYPVGLRIDNSDRLIGTMRVAEMLKRSPRYRLDDWVDGEVWRMDPWRGLFAILDRRTVGVVPPHELHSLSRGAQARFRIARILPDGKVELSLRKRAGEAVVEEADQILRLLEQPEPPRIGDKSTPGDIRALLGISKKAFKRATGRLLKERRVAFNADGHLVRTADEEPSADG